MVAHGSTADAVEPCLLKQALLPPAAMVWSLWSLLTLVLFWPLAQPVKAEESKSVVLAFLGRSDSTYSGLLDAVQRQASGKGLKILMPAGSYETFAEMEPKVEELLLANPGSSLVYMGHGMGVGGAAAAQTFAATSKTKAQAVVLLAGFLGRAWRPSITACAKTWDRQPSLTCPGKPLCPGGYLPEGVHNCTGPSVPAPQYPLPTLSIGGELDGVVRVSRLAEAWYTQEALPQHKVKLVAGMSHSDLVDVAPAAVTASDLQSEIGPDQAREAVAEIISDYLMEPGRLHSDVEAALFGPFVRMFVEQEGSWWWTSNSDEHGSSQWAADAQQKLAEPLPEGVAWTQARNEFRMLSDEDLIPPYYRTKHRPNISFQQGVVSSTVTQLRYVQVSVLQTFAGLNGWEIIREEKAGVLADSKNSYQDDGASPTSAIEIATKLASRELVFNVTGHASSPDLDQGDRCKTINQAAYELALGAASEAARARYQKQGRPLIMVADRKPTPPAGPWWIWNYLNFHHTSQGTEVSSWYAFYPMSGPAYGAGNHYCKLLSPARALEWIYTDGIRKQNKRDADRKTTVEFTV